MGDLFYPILRQSIVFKNKEYGSIIYLDMTYMPVNYKEEKMSNIYGELIEYSGISEYIPKDIICCKEFNVDSRIELCEKYKINEIVKVSVFPRIKSSRVIITPEGKSLEGQVLTGKKYIIEGEINIRVDYIAEGESNTIYCLHYMENFTSSMILHKDMINKILLIPSIFIEGINVQLLSGEEMLAITTILATVEQ